MMLNPLMTPLEQQIEFSLSSNLSALKAAFFGLLAALVLCIIAACSLFHGVLRLLFAWLGLMIWAVALLLTGLYWLRAWCAARSTLQFHHDGNGDESEAVLAHSLHTEEGD